MSLAGETRRAIDRHPFLECGLRAGVVNYTAAARYLEVEGETDAIATAIRRYGEELSSLETTAVDARVRMESGVGVLEDATDPLCVVGGVAFGADAGDQTAIVATGEVDAAALATVLELLAIEGIDPTASAVAGETLLVVVARTDGATALRTVESALESVPRR